MTETTTDRYTRLHRYILEEFAKSGKSPTVEDMMVATHAASREEVTEALSALEERGYIHRLDGDEAITHAYPFSNEPTQHIVELSSQRRVYAMCAIDALGIPFMLRETARIRSECASCGVAVAVDVTPGERIDVTPSDLVVGNASSGCCSVSATDLCPHLNFFCSEEHLNHWNEQHPDQQAKLISLEDGIKWGRKSFETLMSEEHSCGN